MKINKPLKIIFICNEYPPAPHGGIGVFVKMLSEELVKYGHSIAVIGYDPNQKEDLKTTQNGVLIWRLKNPYIYKKRLRLGRFYISSIPIRERKYLSSKLDELVENFKPDLVESYDWSGPLWRKPASPLVVRLHGANSAHQFNEGLRQSSLLYYLERRNLKLADAICSVSDHVASLSSATFKLTKIPIATIYNFVDLSLFKEVSIVERDPFRLLYVGRLHPRKGLTELFKIIDHFFNLLPEYYLEIIGPENKQYQEQLLATVSDEVKDRITFKGKVDHRLLPEVFSSATLFLMPSRAEAFGLTAIEAMACNTPVFMTDRASGPEIINDGMTGFLFDILKVEDSCFKLTNILADIQRLKQVAKQGRVYVSENFSMENAIKENISFYESVT